MFSPSLNGAAPSASVRTSRRRPRPSSSADSISQPKAKRPRKALNDHIFVAPDAVAEMEEVRATKSAAAAVAKREAERLSLTPRTELTVRGKKPKTAERPSKGDGSIILTANDTYTVSRLPAWPDRLQADSKVRHQGSISSESGYALSLSHTHALVWPYAINHTSPETFTFALPHPAKSTSEALPLGSLVSPPASSSEPGLVVVMPTGKVTYWESVASAATLDLIQQQRHGVELSIPGMMSGETAIQIVNAESAGFVLGFSSGRIAYMSVRDGQGRPAISVQFLRGGSGPVSGGIFGSLRNVLSSAALRGDLAAARAGPSTRPGERTVVTATTKGRLQVWDLHRGGHNVLHAEADARDQIVHALKETDRDLSGLHIETFEVLDLAFAPRSLRTDSMGNPVLENGIPLLILVAMGARDTTRYALVQIKLSPENLDIGLVRHLRSYTTPVNKSATSKPRVHLPDPALVAFVVFDRAVVVVSMAQSKASPESQLLSDGHIYPDHYEDVIDFRKDSAVEIVGTGEEQPHDPHHNLEEAKTRKYRAKHPAVLLLVRGAGVIRVSATDTKKLHSNNPQIVTAKSKMEQAVFFGSQDNNPLYFRGRSEIKFPDDEIAQAALRLSMEILSSTTPYIPDLPALLEQNLHQRASALRSLAAHLKTIEAPLDRKTRWELLWMAEKVHAASKTWAKYDALLQTKPVGQKRGVFNDIVLNIHEKWKTEILPESGELDRIRAWFTKDVYRFEVGIPWSFQVIKYSFQLGEKDHAKIMSLLSEADDFVITALSSAFKFREQNLALYGLQDERLRNGILTTGYESLPEFWTSTAFICANLKRQTDLSGQLVKEYFRPEHLDNPSAPSPDLVQKVRLENPELVDINILCSTERYRWLDDNNEPNAKEALISSLQVREAHIERLADFGLTEEAIGIAVKHKVYNSLASLLIEGLIKADEQMENLRTKGRMESDEFRSASRQSIRIEKRVQDFITQFGADFAVALYRYYLKRGELHALITDTTGKNAYLTEYLRTDPELLKLAWINEVKAVHDFDRASKALLEIASNQETDVWSKKVELSLGKLARMAGKKYSQSGGLIIPDGGNTDLAPTNNQLALLGIQEKIYLYVHPTIKTAIDEGAEQQLAIEALGNKNLLGKAALPELLEEKLCRLITHEAMRAEELVDLLTLMNTHHTSDQGSLMDDQEFFMALQALKCSSEEKEDRAICERIIWRRCMLRDDWADINNTDLKNDQEIHYRLQRTALYATLRACIKNRFFEKPSTFSPMAPSSLIGTATEDLGSRFASTEESIRSDLLSDMCAEDAALSKLIETCQLEKWYQGVLDAAKHSVEEELNAETESGLVMQEVASELEEVELRIAEANRAKAQGRLKARAKYRPKASLAASKMNGGFRSSLRITQ